jgi:hypothetical protein
VYDASPSASAACGTGSDEAAPPAAPYAAAFRRYLSAFQQRDFAAALHALDEAVALEPELVQPHHHRAIVWQLLGDYVKCACDGAACAAIDPHYREREATRRAAGTVIEAYRTDSVVDEGWESNRCHDPGLQSVLNARAAEVSRRRAVVSRPSCDLPCPSVCCYFEDETFTYGVCLTSGELAAVRHYLRSQRIDEAEHLGCIDSQDLPPWFQARAEFVLRGSDGRGRLHYVRRTERRLPRADAWRPLTLGCTDLTWTTSSARACVFVGPGGCAIHDVGSPPGATACRTFVCLTAFVCLLISDFGMAHSDDFSARTMAELREFSLSALPLVSATFSSAITTAAQHDMRSALERAVASDQAGNTAAVACALEIYQAARDRHASFERCARNTLGRTVSDFINRRQP